MARLKLSPPWEIYYKKFEAMFEKDDDVIVIFDGDNYEIKLYVRDEDKACALDNIVVKMIDCGSVKLKVNVYPINKSNDFTFNSNSIGGVFNSALTENDAYLYTYTVDGVFTNPIVYVVFKNEVVQYFTDNISDIHGNSSTLYQELAKDIFEHKDGVFFCTGRPADNELF